MEKQDSNHLLLKKAQAGTQEALESLFSGCRSTLEAYVRHRIGGHLQGEVEIEDVLQETYS